MCCFFFEGEGDVAAEAVGLEGEGRLLEGSALEEAEAPAEEEGAAEEEAAAAAAAAAGEGMLMSESLALVRAVVLEVKTLALEGAVEGVIEGSVASEEARRTLEGTFKSPTNIMTVTSFDIASRYTSTSDLNSWRCIKATSRCGAKASLIPSLLTNLESVVCFFFSASKNRFLRSSSEIQNFSHLSYT